MKKEINIKGTYLGTKYFLQAIGQNQGTLISISSSNALAAIPTQSCYCAGKAAIIRMLETVHLGKSTCEHRMSLTRGRSTKRACLLASSRIGQDSNEYATWS